MGKAPGTIQLKTTEQIRPHTGAGTFQSTNHSSNSGVFHKRTQSVKRPSRNTMNAQTTLESAMTLDKTAADPRFKMYNKEMIKGALEKRRVRRAQSNIRPRQRFSTITVFHKNDVSPAAQQQEDIMQNNSSKYRSIECLKTLNRCLTDDALCVTFKFRRETLERDGLLVVERQFEPRKTHQEDQVLPDSRLQLGASLLDPFVALPRPSLTR